LSATLELSSLSDAYLTALLERKSHHARRVIDDALAGGVSVRDVYLRVLQPALHELGRRWAAGDVNVAYEHYATAITERLLATLSARMTIPPTDGRLVVVACTPGEQHVLGARMLRDFLEADGWEVLHLGASTPAGALADLVAREGADAVALSTSTPSLLGDARETVARLAALDPPPFIVVGGQAWPRDGRVDARSLGADLLADDVEAVVTALRERFPPRADEDD
jgi:methanogenic corrinoid protein MtbC1